MGEVHYFNTGRMYARDDQPIVWTRLPSGVVMFRDLGRGIDGYVDQIPEHVDEQQMPRRLMERYDRGQYAQWPREGEPHWYEIHHEEAAKAAREAPRLRI